MSEQVCWLAVAATMVGVLVVCCSPADASSGESGTRPTVYWGQEPIEEISPTRGRIVLNGVWQFMPALGNALGKPTDDMGYIWVPGAWHRTGWAAPALNGVIAPGSGRPWQSVDWATLARGWYQREITVPETWAGREILLNVDRLCTDGIVYVDGKECGRLNWPGGEVTLTPHVVPGRKAVLTVLVAAVPNAGKVDDCLSGAATQSTGNNTSFSRGLVGDVFLESRPKGTRVDGVFVQTSVRRHELALDVDVTDVAAPGAVAFTATVRDANGEVARRFEASAHLIEEPQQTLRVTWPWESPKLWDFRQPNLYTLHLHAKGQNWSDDYVQRFGFREFRIDGKDFLLNEKPFRLRPAVAKLVCDGVGMWSAIQAHMDSMVRAGFNFIELWPKAEMSRGLALYWKHWAAIGDEKGVPIMYPALNPTGIVPRSGGSPAQWAEWERMMVKEWKKVRNHPSILTFVCTANIYQHNDDQNPRRIGNLKALAVDTSGTRLARLFAPGLKAMDIIRRYETTRPVTTHHGASVGDFHTCDMYLDMIPLQEREEWLSAWAASDQSGPFMAIEFGTPWMATFHRGRNNGGHARVTEPFLTEWSAVYFGSDAYRQESHAYRRLIEAKFQGDQRYSMWGKITEPDYKDFPEHCRLQALFIRNTWRSWRTWGLTGGLIPWASGYGWGRKTPAPQVRVAEFRPGQLGPHVTPDAFREDSYFRDIAGYYHGFDGRQMTEAGEALVETNSDTLAWITGPPEAFTAKDHHFVSGEIVRKQVALINDCREEQAYECRVSVEVGGTTVASFDETGQIGVGQTVFVPVEFEAQKVAQKTGGRIMLKASIGDVEHADVFDFRIFPRVQAQAAGAGEVLCLDPAGDTSKALRELGWQTAPWDGHADPGKVLVIGRNALSSGAALPGSLHAFVASGGRAIVFGQDPDWLRETVGLRVARHVSRRFYPVPSVTDHPVLMGLDQEDLRDWRGAGTLVPETANDNLDKDFTDWRSLSEGRMYGWHWGNRGSVSSAAIEKPHRSGWRPLLEGEFDLAYSPLMELNYGKGLLILCSLDLDGRTEGDPVAQTLVSRLIDYAEGAKVTPRAEQTIYLGGPAGEETVQLIGLRYQKGDAIPEEPALLVIGADYQPDEAALRAFLRRGGRAFFLAREAESLPLGFRSKRVVGFHGSMNVPDWPECHGLSQSDLRLRADITAPLLRAGQGDVGADGLFGRVKDGDGIAMFMQLEPGMLNAEERTYLRYSQWRVTRTMTQILSNLGGVFEMDGKVVRCLEAQSQGPADPYYPGFRTDFALGDDPYRYKRW